MEIKKILVNNGIVGIVSNYKNNLKLTGLIKDLKVKDISKALKIVGLDESFIDKKIEDLTISELWKIDLVSKLDNEIIIVGNMSNSLIYKDLEYIKKLLIKLHCDYQKKIVVIDNDINSFINLTNIVFVMKDKEIIYETSNLYDDELYKFVKMPKIVEFIKYVNKENKILNETTDIYELIKDIYRVVS